MKQAQMKGHKLNICNPLSTLAGYLLQGSLVGTININIACVWPLTLFFTLSCTSPSFFLPHLSATIQKLYNFFSLRPVTFSELCVVVMEVKGSLMKHWHKRGALSTRRQLDKCGMTIRSSTWSLWVILQEQTFRFFNISVQGLCWYLKNRLFL